MLNTIQHFKMSSSGFCCCCCCCYNRTPETRSFIKKILFWLGGPGGAKAWLQHMLASGEGPVMLQLRQKISRQVGTCKEKSRDERGSSRKPRWPANFIIIHCVVTNPVL